MNDNVGYDIRTEIQSATENLSKEVRRRFRSRAIRAVVRQNEHVSLDKITPLFDISRATYYNLMAELEAWEEKQSGDTEAREISTLGMYRGSVWKLVSGRLLLAYARNLLDSETEALIERRNAECDTLLDVAPERIVDPLLQ
jgi:hypothetical protein